MDSSGMQLFLTDRIPYDEALILWQRCSCQDVFNHPGCWRALLESGVHPGELACIEVRDSSTNLRAVWPFIIKRGGANDLFARIAEPLGAHYVDYISPIVDSCEQEQVSAGLVKGIEVIFRRCGKMRLPKFVKNSVCTHAHQSIKGIGLFSHYKGRTAPRLRFAISYPETEKSWGKSHRPVVRRKLRYLEREGEVDFWWIQDGNEIKKRLSILYELHKSKWGGQNEPSQFERMEDQTVFRLMVDYLPDEHLHYSEIRLNGVVVSCHFGFLYGRWLYWYKPAYNREYSKLSPGLVHIAFLVEHGINSGFLGLDFLQGDEEYKFRWSNDEKETLDIVLANPIGFPWWLWETKMRNMVRQKYSKYRKALRRGP